MLRRAVFVLALLTTACDGAGDPDAGASRDAGHDAGASMDGGAPLDAGPRDGGVDAGGDAGPDAGDATDGGPTPDAGVDPDGDGYDTAVEVACGTDPADPDDAPDPATPPGAGTEADPYLLCVPEHLEAWASAGDAITAHARLAIDLDVSGVTAPTAIGTMTTPFVGVLDGDGHALVGLTVGTAETPGAGLFGWVGAEGIVRDLTLTGATSFGGSPLVDRNEGAVHRVHVEATVTLRDHGGLVVNRNLEGGLVADASSAGAITATNSHIGGLVGENQGLVLRSWSGATVRGDNRTGGLVGSGGGAVRQSYAVGDVTGARMWIGGLVGTARGAARIEDSYALGAVQAGEGAAGGVIGNLEGTAVVTRVYARNEVVGTTVSAGVVGEDTTDGAAAVSDCYFDASLTASDPLGCTALSASEAETSAAYGAFDFDAVWQLEASVRPSPSLRWE